MHTEGHLAAPDKLRALYERINPNLKKERLEAEKKDLEARFLKAYLDCLSQTRLAETHRRILEETAITDPGYARKQEVAEAQDEAMRQLQIFASNLEHEIELIDTALSEMQQAGSKTIHSGLDGDAVVVETVAEEEIGQVEAET